MMWQQLLVVVYTTFCSASTIYPGEHLAQRDRTPYMTLMPRDQPKAATITLAPKTNYDQTPPNAPKIDGTEFSLVTDSDGGGHLYFPKVLQDKLDVARNNHCSDHGSSDCHSAIDQAIQPSKDGLQKRFLVTAGAISLVAGAVIELAKAVVIAVGVLGVIFLGKDALEAVSAAQPSSTVVYVTTANDPSPITVISTATPVDQAA